MVTNPVVGRLFFASSMMLASLSGCSCGSNEKKPIEAPATGTSGSSSGQGIEGPAGELSFDGPAGGLLFEAPSDYQPVIVQKSDLWHHQHALRSSKLKLEVRYGLAPKAVGQQLDAACGGDSRCKAAPSNQVLESLLDAAVAPIAKERRANRRKAFPLDAVREEFNAHWGGVVNYDLAPAFSGDHKQGLAVVIHREGRGTAMFTALYDEHSQQLEDEWMRAFHSLKFSEPFTAKESADLAAPLDGTRWKCDEGFMHMRFMPSTWTIIHVSAALAAMGQLAPYETIYHEVRYLPGSRFSARVFRIDNMEQGDRTPEQPTEERFEYTRNGDELVVRTVGAAQGDAGEKAEWKCTLIQRR
jgi:hypothetical protein